MPTLIIFAFLLKSLLPKDCSAYRIPPVLLKIPVREWNLPESTPVGTIITYLNTTRSARKKIFGIEGIDGTDKFFGVNEHSGIVYLKSPLNYTTYPTFTFYATLDVGPGRPFHKLEIFVRVLPSTSSTISVKNNQHFSNQDFLSQNSTANHNSLEYDYLSSVAYNITPETDNRNLQSFNTTNNLQSRLSTEESYIKSPEEIPIINEDIKTIHLSNETLLTILIPVLLAIVILPGVIAIACWKIKLRSTRRYFHRPTQLNPLYHQTPVNGYIYSTPEPSPNQEITAKNDVLVFAENKWNEMVEPLNFPLSCGSSDERWECSHNAINFIGVLGEGCFGKVWQAEFKTGNEFSESIIVAVKTLKDDSTEKDKKDLLCELNVMKMLDPHPNIIKLLGCCTLIDPIYVIMEYVNGGKLQTYLRVRRNSKYSYTLQDGSSLPLTSHDLTCFTYQVAKGMKYLSSKGILHRDLAARNILISDNKVCKISDFGLARDVIENHVYQRKSEGRLPIRWMAPESLFDNIFTTKSDVWSFGILMWEIVTLGSTPYAGITATDVMMNIKEGLRLEKPDHCKRELYNVMFYCWCIDPDHRPTFGELGDILEKLLLSETEYIDLNEFPDHYYYNLNNLPGEKL